MKTSKLISRKVQKIKAVAFAMFISLLIVACGTNDSYKEALEMETAEASMEMMPMEEESGMVADENSEGEPIGTTTSKIQQDNTSTTVQMPINRMIIKTGNLRFESENVNATHANIKSIVHQLNGYLSNDRVFNNALN